MVFIGSLLFAGLKSFVVLLLRPYRVQLVGSQAVVVSVSYLSHFVSLDVNNSYVYSDEEKVEIRFSRPG